MTQTIEQWWGPFRDGDLNGFARLIERYQDDVFAVALATVSDRALAEDVAQETFLAGYTHRDRLRDPAAVGGWLAAIARNLGRDLLRARRRERLVDALELDVASSGELPSQQLERATMCGQVRRALDRVPAKYREVLVLYYSFDRSIESIAHSLGLSQAAALQRLSRGRKLVERHGASLREFAGDVRPRRSFAVAVLALLALRTRAEAAPSSAHPRRRSGRASGVMGLAVMFAFVSVDDASGQLPASPSSSRVVVPESASEPQRTAAPMRVAAAVESCVVSPSPPPRPRPRPRQPARPRSVAPPLPPPAPLPPLPPLGLVEPIFESPGRATAIAVPPPVPPSRPRWDVVNGYLETAAMPAPGDLSYETIALGMTLRAGLTRHIAAHVGMMGMDIVRGTYQNAGMAFGGGLKIGTPLTEKVQISLVAEGARNINVGSLSVKDEWIGRAYTSLTHGTPLWNITLSAGAVATDQGSVTAASPVIGLGSQVAWDEHLGFVFESQYFTRSYLGVDSTSVLAVRFRHHALPRNLLSMRSVRIDVGALLVDKADDTRGLPWVQVGLGW